MIFVFIIFIVYPIFHPQGSLAAMTSITGDAEVLAELDQRNGYHSNGQNKMPENGGPKTSTGSECLGSKSATCVLF